MKISKILRIQYKMMYQVKKYKIEDKKRKQTIDTN